MTDLLRPHPKTSRNRAIKVTKKKMTDLLRPPPKTSRNRAIKVIKNKMTDLPIKVKQKLTGLPSQI
jgi:hypothetical protein